MKSKVKKDGSRKSRWVTVQRCYHGKHNGTLGLSAWKHHGYEMRNGRVEAIGHLCLPRKMSEKEALDWAMEEDWRRVKVILPDLPEFQTKWRRKP